MKKLLALLLVAALLMTLSVSVLAAAPLPAMGTFEDKEVGTEFSGNFNDTIGQWCHHKGGETFGKATVVASGSDDFGNCVKIEEYSSLNWFGCHLSASETRTMINTNFSFSIKFDDMNEKREVGVRYSGSNDYSYLSFNTDGTVSVVGKVMNNFKYETGKWYNVRYYFTYHNFVQVTIEDVESGSKYSDTGSAASFETEYKRVFIKSTATNGGGVYYLDNLSLTEDGTVAKRLKAESFDKIAVNKELKGTNGGQYSYGFSYTNGDDLSMKVVKRAEGDNALEISSATSGSTVKGFDDTSTLYSNAALDLDLKLADRNISRYIAAHIDGTAKNVLILYNDGRIKVGTREIKNFVYEYGENAPWYDIKVYVNAPTGAVKAVISDGKNMFEFCGNIGTTGNHVTNMYFSTGAGAAKTYIDNIKLREFFPKNADFYTNASKFTFDALTDKNISVPQGYSGSSYSNWSVFNHNAGTCSATGEVLDGRKALKISRLTSDSLENTTLRFADFTNEPINGINRIQFDLKMPENLIGRTGGRMTAGNTVEVLDTQKIKVGGEEFDFAYGDWYRISIDYNFGDTNTYNVRVVNLDKKTVVADKVGITTTLTANPTQCAFQAALNNGDYFYIDNVIMSEADSRLYSLEQTWYKEGVTPHLGATLFFNNGIDPANQNNKIVLNGVTYTGAEANKFIDARYMGCASLTGLDGDKTYDVEYKLYDMFGNYATGVTTISTCEKYAFSDITLSSDTLVAGEIEATINAKISCDETANLIFALYEKGAERMCSVKMVNISFGEDSANYTATLTVPNDGKEYEVRAFLWDQNLSPLSVTQVGLSQ